MSGEPIAVLLLTKVDCKFCDHAKSVLAKLAEEFTLAITEEDMESPHGLALAREGRLLFAPGIVINGRPVSYGRPSLGGLRRELAQAAAPEGHQPLR